MAKKRENLKEFSREELQKKLEVFREEIRGIKFKSEGARSKNVKELSGLKKQVARVLTQLNNKKQ